MSHTWFLLILKSLTQNFLNFAKFKMSPDVFILFIILEFHAYIHVYWSFLNTIFLPISFWLPPPFFYLNFTSYFYNSRSYQCCLSAHGCRVSHRSNLTTAMPLEKTDSSYQIFQLSKLLIEEKELHEPLQSLGWNCDWFYLAQALCLHIKFMTAVISISRRHCFIAVLLSYFLLPSTFPTMLFEPCQWRVWHWPLWDWTLYCYSFFSLCQPWVSGFITIHWRG